MPTRRRHARPAAGTTALAKAGAELGMAVPQVVAHRVARMALAGPVLSARDRREFHGMVAEKPLAFVQGWQAMVAQAWKAQQALASAWWGAAWPTWLGAALRGRADAAPLVRLAREQHEAGLGIVRAGLQPVRRKAVANARRLRRTPLK